MIRRKTEKVYCGFAIQREKEEREMVIKEFKLKLEYFEKERDNLLKAIELEIQKENPNMDLVNKNRNILKTIEAEIVSIERFLQK